MLKTNLIGSFRLSQLNSGSVQAQLRAAGIDTNSKQYKAAVKRMTQNSNGAMYANVQGIILRENGVLNGDTTKRSEAYTNMY